MRAVWDNLWCQLFHSRWAQLVSYSRQGGWRCTKPGCRAQRRADERRRPGPAGQARQPGPPPPRRD